MKPIPSEVVGELLLDMVLSMFGKVDMQLPFLPIIGATDASTEFGHGGVVAQAEIDVIRKIARMACKSGGHVCVGDGPSLPPELAARLDPRYDLNSELRDFDVIFSVRVESPSHINIEEAAAVICYLRFLCVAPNDFAIALFCLLTARLPWVRLPKAGRRPSLSTRLYVGPLLCVLQVGSSFTVSLSPPSTIQLIGRPEHGIIITLGLLWITITTTSSTSSSTTNLAIFIVVVTILVSIQQSRQAGDFG